MKINSTKGLEYASPVIKTVEVDIEAEVLSSSKGFVVSDYEDDGEF